MQIILDITYSAAYYAFGSSPWPSVSEKEENIVDDSDNNSQEMENLKTEIWSDILSMIERGNGEVRVVIKRLRNCSIEVLLYRAPSRRRLLLKSGRDNAERIVLKAL